MKKIVLDSGAALLSRRCFAMTVMLKQVARRAFSSPRGTDNTRYIVGHLVAGSRVRRREKTLAAIFRRTCMPFLALILHRDWA
jgi:hypothetical protein